MDLAQRFRDLTMSTRRAAPQLAPPPERREPPAISRADLLHGWASAPECVEALAWLAAEAESANATANRLVGSAQGAWWLGYEAATRAAITEIKTWRGQPASAPPARPAQRKDT